MECEEYRNDVDHIHPNTVTKFLYLLIRVYSVRTSGMELNMPRPGGDEAEGDDADICVIGIDKVNEAGRDVAPPPIIMEDDLLTVT